MVLWIAPFPVAAEALEEAAPDEAESTPVTEDDEKGGEGEPLPWYEVEVIVFRQWELGGSDRERWPSGVRDPYYPLWQLPLGCGWDSGDAAGDEDIEAGSEELDHSFRCLPEDRLQMRAEWNALRGSGDYRPLIHIGWEQPGIDEDHSIAVPVPVYWQPPPAEEVLGIEPAPPRLNPEVYGLIRVYRERFLHAVVDLRFLRTGSGAEVDIEEMLRAPVHVMQQSRRMRSGQRHYLDHPALGVIIEVRELEDREEEEQEENGDE